MKNDTIIKSISYDNDEIIKSILELHIPNKIIDCDPCFSKGNFYKNNDISVPKYKFDIYPQTEDTVKADCRHLPLEDKSIDSLIFDPPFGIACGPSLNKTKKGSNVIPNRFSSFPTPLALYKFYDESLAEFNRVLKDDGVLVFKCQDTVSGGINYMSHVYIHNMALSYEFYPKDLFILNSKNRLISGKHKHQQHARKFHSYFWVFEKGNNKFRKVNSVGYRGGD